MRAVFQKVFPDANIETATPISVLAVEDKRNVEALEPEAYLGKGKVNLAGLFLQAPEKAYVLIWLKAPGLHPYAPIYHEYAHFVFGRTGQWMPLWLMEGWAEFYQTPEILDNEVLLGKVDARTADFLQHNPLLPLPALLAVDQHSPYYHEQDKGSMFYAESWALTHYLKTNDDLENTHRLADYLDLVHKNIDVVSAATQAFGDLTQLQADLQKYISNGDYAIEHVSGATDVDDSSFTVRSLTPAQANTLRADFLAYNGRSNDASTLLQSVLHDDPANVSAHQTMGFVALSQGNYDEARKWYEKAIKLDPQSFLAQYYFAAIGIKKGMPNPAEQARIEDSLRTSMKLNPSFAPTYEAFGALLGMRGKNYDEAHEWIQKSIQMDPGNIEFRIDEANVLLRMNKNKEAVEALEVALRMTHTPEQTAAVENVLQSARKFEALSAKMHRQGLVIGQQGAQSNAKGVTSGSSAGSKNPVGIYTPPPEYTEEARQAKREGVCVVSLIVGIDGKTSNIVVTKKLGMGLDEKAVEAVRKWKFEPATRFGKPVMTRLIVNVGFKLFGISDTMVELSQKARAGDPQAEFELANAFFDGRDIPKDDTQGMALLERSARDGLPQAQFQMGERTYGDGTNPENYVSAYVWYSLAQRGGLDEGEAKAQLLEAQMTADQVSEARKRLEDWSTPERK